MFIFGILFHVFYFWFFFLWLCFFQLICLLKYLFLYENLKNSWEMLKHLTNFRFYIFSLSWNFFPSVTFRQSRFWELQDLYKNLFLLHNKVISLNFDMSAMIYLRINVISLQTSENYEPKHTRSWKFNFSEFPSVTSYFAWLQNTTYHTQVIFCTHQSQCLYDILVKLFWI